MNATKPRYLQIYEEIRLRLRNAVYQAGDFLPTEAELCREFSTSRPTISKALKLLSEEKLISRKAGFGTKVLEPKKSPMLAGLLVPQILNTEIFEPICASIAENAGIAGMRVIHPSQLNLSGDVKTLTSELADHFIEQKVKGVFYAPVEHVNNQLEFNLEIINRLSDKGIRVVLIDRDIYPWPRQSPCDLIGIDNIEAGFVVATHLLNKDCSKLAFVSLPNPASTVALRRSGCREALIQKGLRARTLVDVEFDPKKPSHAVEILRQNEVDGVVCANDVTAASLMRSLLDQGASIPKRIKVCGFDDVKYASLLSVPLTSYQQPCRDIGRVAADLMRYRIKHPNAPTQRIALQGQLVIRTSSQ
ncbi:GntR family transcriptional regulator [Rubritalea spongiae]|uniref:GntR family transcriptional regulator n=1 Tax=Rubritalea spongiae TaxID=430797 RepID=A0ABW5E0A0_9BACT